MSRQLELKKVSLVELPDGVRIIGSVSSFATEFNISQTHSVSAEKFDERDFGEEPIEGIYAINKKTGMLYLLDSGSFSRARTVIVAKTAFFTVTLVLLWQWLVAWLT